MLEIALVESVADDQQWQILVGFVEKVKKVE